MSGRTSSFAFFPLGLLLALTLCLSSLVAIVDGQTDTNLPETSEPTAALAQQVAGSSSINASDWNQWRGPQRTGLIQASVWPESIEGDSMKKLWSVALSPSYSGPLAVGERVFTTESKERKFEVASAYDRVSGKLLWSTSWEGSMSVPFFAKSNGDWIRSTPAYDNGKLYVGGMKDVLVCLDAETGKELWKFDFPQVLKTAVPSFGFVCSPLIDGEYLYVQAGGGFCKLEKVTGKLVWRSLDDGGGMMGSAFSSPVLATMAGVRQAIVQTRTKLSGVDLETGKELWSQEIPTFRGMNIITPIVHEDHLFVSAYGGTTQLIKVSRAADGTFSLNQVWNLPSQGYMNSPVVIADHAYIHLKNQRIACYSLKSGKETWRSKPMGKYASMIGNGDKILVLDERGDLMLLRANPEKFELISSRKVGDDSWAHLAIRDDFVFVRNLNELVAFKWEAISSK
jgi:outer membrane protein assembly factor BamB